VNTHHRRPYRPGVLALALLVAAAGCGDDDGDSADDAAQTAATDAPEPSEPADTDAPAIDSAAPEPPATEPPPTEPERDDPPGTAPDTDVPGETQPADLQTFCSTVIAADAVASAGPQVDFATASEAEIGEAMEAFAEALVPLLDQLTVGSPEEVADDVATIDSAVRASFETGEDPFSDPVVLEADRTIDRFMAENCGYEMVTVTALEYAFEGVPTSLPATTVGFEFDNQGNEVHEMIVMRINDDVDATVEELLELPEEEAMSKTRFMGAAFAPPGASDITFIDLVPGRYVMLCFVPVGTLSIENGPPPEGPPHVMHGMVHGFEVV
jgi:hypothetical protein